MATKDCISSKAKQHRHTPYSKQKQAQCLHQQSRRSTSSMEEPSDAANIKTLQHFKQGDNLKEDAASETYPCISARQPYAGFILNGLKTIETRWTPVFSELEGRTVAIHVAWKDWEGGDEWRTILEMDYGDEDIDRFIRDGERHGRAVVAGLVDVGKTWQCPFDVQSKQTLEWEKSALLRPLNEKFLTKISNPRWLRRPVPVRGQRGIWEVKIPLDCL